MKNKLTLQTIADNMGVHLSTIYRWCYGDGSMTAEDAKKLETITGVRAEAWVFPRKFKNIYFREPKPHVKRRS